LEKKNKNREFVPFFAMKLKKMELPIRTHL